MYAPGKGYNVFAGKDGSKGLGECVWLSSVRWLRAVYRDVVAGHEGRCGRLFVAERGADEHAEPVGVVLRKGACAGADTVADCGSDTALWAALCSSNSREIRMQCVPHSWPCDLTKEGPPIHI